jgi:hypothetical protein
MSAAGLHHCVQCIHVTWASAACCLPEPHPNCRVASYRCLPPRAALKPFNTSRCCGSCSYAVVPQVRGYFSDYPAQQSFTAAGRLPQRVSAFKQTLRSQLVRVELAVWAGTSLLELWRLLHTRHWNVPIQTSGYDAVPSMPLASTSLSEGHVQAGSRRVRTADLSTTKAATWLYRQQLVYAAVRLGTSSVLTHSFLRNHSYISHVPSPQMPIVRSAALAALLDALAALKFGGAAALLWLCGRGGTARSLLGAWTVNTPSISSGNTRAQALVQSFTLTAPVATTAPERSAAHHVLQLKQLDALDRSVFPCALAPSAAALPVPAHQSAHKKR